MVLSPYQHQQNDEGDYAENYQCKLEDVQVYIDYAQHIDGDGEVNGRKRSEKYPPSLAKAMEFIRKNGFKMLSCRDIARNAGVSERKLNELFRSFLHTAPAQYLIQRRLNFAGELLASGKFSIKETAVMSGFSTPEFFIRQFKKHTGITPGKYQEKL